MKNKIKKIIAMFLAVAMVMQTCYLENYGYILNVFAEPVKTSEKISEGLLLDEKGTSEGVDEEKTTEALVLESSTENIPDIQKGEDEEKNEEIKWNDFSVDGGVIESGYSLQSATCLTGDLRIKGDLNIEFPLELNGYSLMVEGDIIHNSDIIVNGDLIVYGNYICKKGKLSFSGGYVDVMGDFIIMNDNDGFISMRNEEDYLCVTGDFLLGQCNKLTTDITNGIIELKGDFIQKVIADNGKIIYSEGDFRAEGNSILLLSGEGKQNIYIAKETSGFDNITTAIQTVEQDVGGNYIFGDRQIGFSGLYNYKNYEEYGWPTTYGYAECDTISLEDNMIYGSCYYTGEPLHINGNNLTVVGDFIQGSDVYLESGTFTVLGDYRIQSLNIQNGEFGETDAKFVVQNYVSVYIYGEFITQSTVDHSTLLTNGIFFLYGGIYQLGKNSKNFATSGNFNVYLYKVSGEARKERHIYTENPTQNMVNYLVNMASADTLIIDNGACFGTGTELGDYSGYVLLKDKSFSDSYNGDVKIIGDITFSSITSINGNLIIESNVIINKSLHVAKDITVKKGVVQIGNGTIYAENVCFEDGSDSALRMETYNSSLQCNNFYYGSNRTSEPLTDGSIRFVGDFYVKDTGTHDSFVSSGTHKVIASGKDSLQKITIENPASGIETLVTSNIGNAMTYSAEGTVIHNVKNDTDSYAWEGISGYTLEQDMVYNEDLILFYGIMDLNGHTLTVNGDLYAERGTIKINGGKLVVNGDLKCVYRDWEKGELELESSTADIIMGNKADQIDIAGDWYAIFNTHSLNYMTAGTINLAGNMNIEGSVGSKYSKASERIMNGTNLYLDGSEKQTISGISSDISVRTGDMVVVGEHEINVELPIYVTGTLQLPETSNYTFHSIEINNLDRIVGHLFKGDITAGYSELTGDVTIDGNLIIDKRTDLHGYNLYADQINIKGDTILSGGAIYANELFMQNKIYMQKPEDKIEVENMYVNIISNDSDYMTDGNIYITGSFLDSTSDNYAFLPSGNHVIQFSLDDKVENKDVGIIFSNTGSKLNKAIFNSRISRYSLNRKKEEVANELIIGYEDNEKPSIPENIVCIPSYCYVEVKWDTSDDNMELDYYKLYRNGIFEKKLEGNCYVDAILKPGTTYRYQIAAVDVRGNESDISPVVEVTTLREEKAPSFIKEPKVTVAENKVEINCEGIYADKDSYVDYYIIKKDGEEVTRLLENASFSYTDADNNLVIEKIHEVSPCYVDENLEYDKLYEYCITAVDMAGNESDEYILEVVADLPAKSPDNFTVVSENGYNIISFEKSGSVGCSSYWIVRDNAYGIKTIDNDKKEQITYVDSNVKVGEEHTYYIQPFNKYEKMGQKTESITITTIGESNPPMIGDVRYSIPGDVINGKLSFIVETSDDSGMASIYAYVVKEGEDEKIQIDQVVSTKITKVFNKMLTLKTDDLKGEYALHIVARDHCGNETEVVKQLKINIDGLPPVNIVDTAASASTVYFEWEKLEGADYYLIEKKQGSDYVPVGNTINNYCHITDLMCETAYTYRIVAYDADGIRGLSTEDIKIVTTVDTEAPCITEVYANNIVLGSNMELQIGYKDNSEVKMVRAYYRMKGEGEWHLIEEKTVNKQIGTLYMNWNKSGLEDGVYEVLYQAEDTMGNESEDLIRNYNLDLQGPIISNFTLTPEDWQIRVDWDAFTDKDFNGYELKRMTADEFEECQIDKTLYGNYGRVVFSGVGDTTFKEQISPDKEYVYILYAYDKYNNVSVATVNGRSINNDIFSPEVGSMQPLYAAKGFPITLSARGCSDNDTIASYMWNMGNGEIIYGENCEYTYDAAGTYEVELTVIDGSGNRNSERTTVTVGMDTGLLKVKVVSGDKNLAEADVVAYMNGNACHSASMPQTDSQGMLTFPMAEGTYKIAAYKAGYIPKETEVTIHSGETKEITINLEKGEMVTSKFETHEMSEKEMEAAGIDMEANKAVFEYTVELKFGKDRIETIKFNNLQKSTTCIIPCGIQGDADDDEESEEKKKRKKTKVTVSNISEEEDKPVFFVTKTVDVSLSWLKNIYEVEATICNESGKEFSLENATATIKLDDGLELAQMKKGESNPETWKIGTLKGGESKSNIWYVGGSKTGSYPLKVQMDAVLQPFNKEIHKTMVSEENLEVEVGKGLCLYIYPEEDAYIGEKYYVQFELKNESKDTYRYVTTDFGKYGTTTGKAKVITIVEQDGSTSSYTTTTDTGVSYYIATEDGENSQLRLQDKDTMTIEKLKPGGKICGTRVFQFDAVGDIDRDYYHLINKYVAEENVNNTNMTVVVKPISGHLTKKNVTIKLPSKKDSDDGGGSDGNKSSGNGGSSSNDGWNPYNPTTPNSTQTVKDPINLMTGAFTINHVVAAVSGAAKLEFDVSYNSLYANGIGEFGRGWYHNYEMHIERNGSMITLYQNPYEMMYFLESEETANTVCGTIEEDTIVVSEEDYIERTYYQAGSSSKKYRITKSLEGYVLFTGTEKYIFDIDGNITEYINENGQRVFITKTGESMTIEDCATGKCITAHYDKDGRIESVADATGEKATFQYTKDCMTLLNDKNGIKLIYEYDDNGHILVGKEGDGKVYVENTFDDRGRILTQIENGKEDECTGFSYKENTEEETTAVIMMNADGTKEQAVSDKYGQGIRYVDAIGRVKEYTYNKYHEMTAYCESDGNGEDYIYDSNGNISKVVEATGKTTNYTYDSNNRVIRMKCNDGTDIIYTYNQSGQIESLTSGNGLKVEYTYNENGQVLTETSALGTMEYIYEKGMLRCLKDYSGNNHYFTYDANGNVIQYIDGSGIVTDYEVDASGRVKEESIIMEDGSRAVTSYTYDAYGKVLSKTDALGNTTGYAYDEEDRLVEEMRPDGKSYTYEYDANGNVKKITCPDGSTTAEAVYDAAGNGLSLTDTLKNIRRADYSAGSQLLSMTQGNGGEIRYTYYDNGLLESQTDANGNTTNLVYDEAGRISQVSDGSGAVTTFGYDKDGNLETVEDALGNLTKLVYNQYRKVISQTDASGNVTKYGYDSALNCIRVTDAEGGVTEFSYDARGQILSLTKKGDTKEQDVTLSMTYDNLGNVTSLTDGEGNTSRMEYDLNSRLTAVYDAKGVRIQKYEYDCLGNCISTTDALGNVTGSSYDDMGNLVKQMNEATGNAVSYSYIGGQYLASSTDAFGNTASATYDSSGNIATLTNPNGGVTSYRYDLNNNLTDESIGTDYHVRYTYNAKNLMDARVNSRDQETAYEYDALGRLTRQTDEAGVIDYTYDANGNVLTVTETAGAAVNTITRTYDGLNRVTSYTDAKGNTIGYEYDRIGNLVKLTYPYGKAVTYTYDKNCNIKTVTDWNSRTTTYSYDSNGRLVKTERPNGTVEIRTYDKAGNLTQILDKCGSTVVNQQEYTYDASGNITEVKQLYDGDLNFTGVTAASMTYDENNRLLTYNGETVQYDKDGNMTYGPLQGKMTEFVFDCRNRLVKAGDTSYEYDAENHRVAVITGSKRTEYVVDSRPELSQVLQSTVTEGDKEETTYYFHGKGLLSQENSKGYLTYHFNNVGSTMTVTDAKGKVTETYNYTPYGELIDGTYSDNIPFLYNGQYGVTTDANGLYYMRARYYNVDIKRFINQDVLTGTLERISSLNRYAYVEGNPISYLDPFGLDKWIYEELHDATTRISFYVNSVALLLGIETTPLMIGFNTAVIGFDLGVYINEFICSGYDFGVLMDGFVNTMLNTSYLVLGMMQEAKLVSETLGNAGSIASQIKNSFDYIFSYLDDEEKE